MITLCKNCLLLFTIALLAISNISSAQVESSEIEARLDSLLNARNYEYLETYAFRTLMLSDSLKTGDRASLHKYLGIVYIIKGREGDGKRQFTQWLSLDPAGFIDRFNYPPMIVRVFKEVKSEIDELNRLSALSVKEKWKPDKSSILKSTLVPGWGQLEQGKTARGISYMIVQSASIAGWLISNHNLTLANNAYQRETGLTRFDELYDKTNNWNYTRWAFTFSTVAVYVLIQADFYFLPPEINLSAYSVDQPPRLTMSSEFFSSPIYHLPLIIIHL